MDLDAARSLYTVLAFVAFVGIVVWAYSRRRKHRFDEAARLPFDGEDIAGDGEDSREGRRR